MTGTLSTQLYDRLIVFNRKRVGEFTFGERTYSFHRWRETPKRVTPEFLVVELLNRIEELSEDREQVLDRLKDKLPGFNRRRLLLAASKFGTLSTQKKLKQLLEIADSKEHSV